MILRTYIFGASTNGEQCLRRCRKYGIEVVAFLDNFTDKKQFCGLPVLRPENANKSVPVVITSPTACMDIWMQLRWMGFLETVHLSGFFRSMGIEPEWEMDILRDRASYQWVRDILWDAESRRVFDAMMMFRKTLDPIYMATVRRDIRDQWFDPEFFRPGAHVYVDGGAYNGDTAMEFLKRSPGYHSAYLFEPSSGLAAEAALRTKGLPGVFVRPMGLSNGLVDAKLEDAGLPGGRVGGSGEPVELTSIDIDVPAQATFIKLDVEGSELLALQGAKAQIQVGKPMIACAVYHRPEDIREIPWLLAEYRRDYRFYLRHYTQSHHETVLYAV